MSPKHLQHTVDCTAPDRSEFALNAIPQFVNFGSMVLFPALISKAPCCASLTALSKKKCGLSPIVVGEMLRRLIAKCPASEAKSEAIELFDSLQLGVGVSGGTEATIPSSKITYANIISAQSYEGVLQNDSQNALDSVRRSHLLKKTCELPCSPIFATPSTHHSFITMQSSKVDWVFRMVTHSDPHCSP